MKYQANPVIVDAWKITQVVPLPGYATIACLLSLDNGMVSRATHEMCARMKPVAGDYLVQQADGYLYLNPADVFQRKYSPLSEPAQPTCELETGAPAPHVPGSLPDHLL